MTVSKTRRAMKKLGPNSLGSKFVRFQVHNIDRRFTVHEDLICRTSALFKYQLQRNRKPLHQDTDMEECCVCKDDLDATFADITYCATCGQNVHNTCIEQWKRTSNTSSSERSPTGCPMCRAAWKNEPLLPKDLVIELALDAEAVQIYLDWLYSSSLRIADNVDRASDEFNVKLLKCWVVACGFDDITFRNDVVTAFFVEGKARFSTESIKWAFTDGHGTEETKEFVVEVFLSYMTPGWFKKESSNWPVVFVRALADRAIEEMDLTRSFEEMKKEWLSDQEKETEDLEDAGVKVMSRKRVLEEKLGKLAEDLSWVDIPGVKVRKGAQSPKSRVHVESAQPSRSRSRVELPDPASYQVHVERRTEREQVKTRERLEALSQSIRVLRSTR